MWLRLMNRMEKWRGRLSRWMQGSNIYDEYDPWLNEEEYRQWFAERRIILGADVNDGKYSVHEEWELSESGATYDLLMWPEEGLGLSATGLEELRREISKYWGESPEKGAKGVSEVFYLYSRKMDRSKPSERDDVPNLDCFAKGELFCPFGAKGKRGVWYGHPVICFRMLAFCPPPGGNGNHSSIAAFPFSIVHGRVLTERDYFRPSELSKVFALVGKEFLRKYGPETEAKYDPSFLYRALSVSEQGMTWWIRPYTMYCGAVGSADVTIPWEKLAPYARPPAEIGAP
jgi:hypothetical protein